MRCTAVCVLGCLPFAVASGFFDAAWDKEGLGLFRWYLLLLEVAIGLLVALTSGTVLGWFLFDLVGVIQAESSREFAVQEDRDRPLTHPKAHSPSTAIQPSLAGFIEEQGGRRLRPNAQGQSADRAEDD
jgi:hypothetical protein